MQDYCIAVHSRYIIKPVAPIDVICLLSYSINELAYQKKENELTLYVLLYLYYLIRIFLLSIK